MDLRRRGIGELNLASRRAEESALRRYQAVHWLDYLVGPLGIPSQPSEKEFISCLRNGLVLCKLINKVQPGSVPKVIESTTVSPLLPWDSQPLPAYQYFENIRNFLVAAEELKLPVFDASVFERDNLQEGLSTKVVDCLLALKAYHEWKQMTGGNGLYKPPRSPLMLHSAGRIHPRSPVQVSHGSVRRLDMDTSDGSNKRMPSEIDIRKFQDRIVKTIAQRMVDSKENIDNNLVASYRRGSVDSVGFFSNILSICFEEQFRKEYPDMELSALDHLRGRRCSPVRSTFVPLADLSNLENRKCCKACLKKGNCNHWKLIERQEKELSNIKLLLSSAKQEVQNLQSQIQIDFKQLGNQVLEMSNAALGYHEAVKENRNLHNMVQDLKGNIRVYCRIRPVFSPEMQNVVDYIGQDGSLVVIDPKALRDGKKAFQFNHVFGPTATQDEVFRDMRSLVRSVMDGYNVCVFAYGQTGSGKTHTMYGPPGGSSKELGISYLALNDLFDHSDQRKDIMKYEIQVQMVEIYNEQIHDLLAEDSGSKKLEIRSCLSNDSLALPDATLRPVKSTKDVINLMRLGEMNRAVGSTAINTSSSRSHSVLSVHVHGEDATGSTLRSCLHLVDLAGSERVDKSEVTGDGLKEALHINKSLACLVDVMTALAQKNSHIPYRNSKLTLLLQNSLGGSAKTLMLAHVNPERDSFVETMSTLKFAQRVSTVELGAARANKDGNLLELRAKIESLKKALGGEEVDTPQTKRTKESARTPLDKPKVNERTPIRARRLSIENSVTVEKKGVKTPSIKPKQLTERTPPRPRRLSIESCGEMINHVEKKGAKTPSTMPRSRRLSLEGPRNVQNNGAPLEDGNVITKSSVKKKASNGSLLEQRAPLSQLSSALKCPMTKIDTATMKVVAPSSQIARTPEPQIRSGNEIHSTLPNIRKNVSEIQTPSTTHGKGSHIRKSLRTIGKLINGSEKRKQQKPTETMLPGMIDVAKSPTSSNARAMRRQSLTGIVPPERSRRSSIGGVSTDSYGIENRNAKTPPPQVRASTKLMKRWL